MTKLMGIVNITPDSFYPRSRVPLDQVVQRALQMVQEGADSIDIGGESTRPGACELSDDEEIRRIEPVLKAVAAAVNIPLSIDTRHVRVAERALELGATIVNDISGGRDPAMLQLVAESQATIVLMHMQGQPENMQYAPKYRDVVSEVEAYLLERCDAALKAGIAKEKIIIDPGIGFGKGFEDNYALIAAIERFKSLGAFLLYGTSRKSFLRTTAGVSVDEVLPATLAVDTFLALKGVDILRVHDVEAHRQMLRVIEKFESLKN